MKRYLDDYEAHHQKRGNQVCHSFGIVFILWGLLGLASRMTFHPPLDAGILLILASSAWYLFLDWRMVVPFVPFLLGFYFLGKSSDLSTLWILFIAGWGLQFLGHFYFEKNQPAFSKNFLHLLMGPIWVFIGILRFLT